MGLGAEANLGDSIITTKLDEAINWARSYSMWPMAFGTACCGIEFMSVAAAKYDISRFGAEVVRFSPRQADLLIVAGTITYKQAPVLKKIWIKCVNLNGLFLWVHVHVLVAFMTTIQLCKELMKLFL